MCDHADDGVAGVPAGAGTAGPAKVNTTHKIVGFQKRRLNEPAMRTLQKCIRSRGNDGIRRVKDGVPMLWEADDRPLHVLGLGDRPGFLDSRSRFR